MKEARGHYHPVDCLLLDRQAVIGHDRPIRPTVYRDKADMCTGSRDSVITSDVIGLTREITIYS